MNWWLRPSLLILFVATATGAWWRGQPAGTFTIGVVGAAAAACPVASPLPARSVIVGDGARAIDAWAWAATVDLIEGVQTHCLGAGRSARDRITA